jgi:hypothetical protein
LEGCGPCNATRPEWKKIKNVLENKYKNNNNIVVADVDQEVLDKIKSIKNKPVGFPTMFYMNKKDNIHENYVYISIYITLHLFIRVTIFPLANLWFLTLNWFCLLLYFIND